MIVAAAQLLVQYSDKGWLVLLEEHVPDRTGHCAGSGCRGPVWPCVLWVIARHAEELAARPLRAVIEREPPRRRRGGTEIPENADPGKHAQDDDNKARRNPDTRLGGRHGSGAARKLHPGSGLAP
ncbi:MAG: hypothetical protein M3Z25_08675 [Actinomycetota bacterium]|nr:hypothetical protein [Actinomycetota bacterium]